jgi:flagellar export protein FliJ
MKQFRLARVLRLRSRLRHLRQLEAARLRWEQQRTVVRCTELHAERVDVLEHAATTAASGVEGAVLGLLRGYEDVLRERESTATSELARLESLLEKKRGEVARERREERKLEHLARRHRARLEAAAATEAERLVDELALARHVRDTVEGRGGR